MNVVFHAVAGAALASTLYRCGRRTSRAGYVGLSVGAFLVGVAGHGVMDVAPHHYPFRAALDIALAIAVFVMFALAIRRDAVLLFGLAYLGSLFPDLVDLGPQMLNQFVGTTLPVSKAKVFFWHRTEYSGSIYDGSHAVLSWVLYGLTIGLSVGAIAHGRNIFRTRSRSSAGAGSCRMKEQKTAACDECNSLYYRNTSQMETLFPECARVLYGLPQCEHVFKNGRCTKCFWDGSASKYVNDVKRT